MFSFIIYITSVVLGSSLLSLQSPKLYNDAGNIVEAQSQVSSSQEEDSANTDAEQLKQEVSQLSAVLQQKAQGAVLGEATDDSESQGPARISEDLQVWLRQDKGELPALQIKTLQDNQFFGSNGSSTQIIVYSDGAQVNQEKILSFSDNGKEQYSIATGKFIEVNKLNESEKWQLPDQKDLNGEKPNFHVATIRTENIFGITDVFFDGITLENIDSHFTPTSSSSRGELILGSFSTDVKEVIQFSRQISEEERRTIESYLRLKYDINLQQTADSVLIDEEGKLVWDPIENEVYSYGMMSLIENSHWELNRTFAEQELQDGSLLSLNINTDSVDTAYLLVGHNNKSTQKITSTHEAFSHMIQRTWKIESTDDIDKISISYQAADNLDGNPNDLALVIGDDSDFSDDRIYTPSIVEGSKVTFSNVHLANEAYFTLLFNKKVDDLTGYTSFQNVNSLNSQPAVGPGGVNTGLALWLRADTGIELENEHVIKWLDQSGRGNDLTADLPLAYGTAPQYIQSELNYYPAIRFNEDRLTDYLGRANFDLTADNKNFTQFIVYRHPQTEKFGGIISYASKLDTNDFLLFNPSELWLFKNGKEQRLDKNSADGMTHIVGVRNNELVGSTDVYLDGNGKLLNYGTSGHEPSGTYIIGQDQDQLGGGFDPEQAFTGDISEVILFHESLSDIDVLKIQSYLAFKYGITLPTMYVEKGEGLMWDDTKNSRYNNNLFGLGQDELSGITQKISRSQDNSLITIKNPRNMEIGEFLMVGDNNAASEVQNNQLSRTWIIQKKGDVGNVDISFDLSKIQGVDIREHDSFVVAVSPDETFVQSKVFTEQHRDGYVITFKNVSLENGQYLSLKVYSQ